VEDLDYLSVDDLLEIGKSIIPDFRVRDLGLIQSAAIRPKLTIYGAEAYVSFPEKVAALMHAVAKNHALIDGNSQLAWASSRAFCLINDKDLHLSIDEVDALITGITAGDYGTAEIVERIRSSVN
jgi:death-on-curing protein